MTFIDGENLTIRYQNMREDEENKLNPSVIHQRNVLAYHPHLADTLSHGSNLLRVNYYTSLSGDDVAQTELRGIITGLKWKTKTSEGHVVPRVFHKPKQSERSRHVDIAITMDILRHCYLGHVDAIWLVSGDKDYLPLIREVMSMGKRVFVAALSSGLAPELPLTADRFFNLDEWFFLGHKTTR